MNGENKVTRHFLFTGPYLRPWKFVKCIPYNGWRVDLFLWPFTEEDK